MEKTWLDTNYDRKSSILYKRTSDRLLSSSSGDMTMRHISDAKEFLDEFEQMYRRHKEELERIKSEHAIEVRSCSYPVFEDGGFGTCLVFLPFSASTSSNGRCSGHTSPHRGYIYRTKSKPNKGRSFIWRYINPSGKQFLLFVFLCLQKADKSKFSWTEKVSSLITGRFENGQNCHGRDSLISCECKQT